MNHRSAFVAYCGLALAGCMSSAEHVASRRDRAHLSVLMEQVPAGQRPDALTEVDWSQGSDFLGAHRPRGGAKLAVYAKLGLGVDQAGAQTWLCGTWAFDMQDRFLGQQLTPIIEAGAWGPPSLTTGASQQWLSVTHDTLVIRNLTWDGAQFEAGDVQHRPGP